jgi:hypothetical protein
MDVEKEDVLIFFIVLFLFMDPPEKKRIVQTQFL